MAENINQNAKTNTDPDVNTTNTKEERVEQEATFETYQKETNEINFKETKSSIKSELAKLDGFLKNLKFRRFKEENNLPKNIQSEEDITDPEMKSKFESYKLEMDDPEVQTQYANARTQLIDITTDRNNKINELYGNKMAKDEAEKVGKVQELLNKVDAEINECRGKEGQEEKLKRLEALKEKIGNKEEKTGLFATLHKIAESQMAVRKMAIQDLAETMEARVNGGDAFVKADEKIKNSIGQLDENGRIVTNDMSEISDDLEKMDQEEQQQEEPKEEQQASQQGKNNGAPVMEGGVPADLKPNYLMMLGFNPGNVLNTKSSMAMLENYVSDKITDAQRVEMLNDPETRGIILEAMDKANKSINPINRIKFNKTRANLVKLAKGEMVRKAVETIGDAHPENLEESFENAKNEYASRRADLESRLNVQSLSDEDRANLENQLAELDEKYQSVVNVEEFRTHAAGLERFRDRAADKISGMFNKNERLPLPKKEDAKVEKNEPQNVEPEKEVNEYQPVDGSQEFFIGGLSGAVNSREEVAEKEAEAIENGQKVAEVKKDEKNKDEKKGPEIE
ncbi:MAG: hypothetical protein J6A15_07105 [Clostridia bacterium]|nr:hypothetical protein [Clostridia bacterium]